MRPIPLALFAALSAAAAQGQVWRVAPDFKNKDARMSISGAACASAEWCVAVNDETGYAQFFALGDRRITPGKRMRVVEKAEGEPDLEGAAFYDGHLYLTGSHGAPRGGGAAPARDLVFRAPVDPRTGAPRFQLTRKRIAPGIERSGALKPLIAEMIGKGAEIEGLAARNGALFFGFRRPVGPAGATVLEVPVGRLFGGGDGSARRHDLDLGPGYGVRSLAAVQDGFLMLAGAAVKNKLRPAIWFWRPGAPPRRLIALDLPKGAKPEGVAPLPGPAPRVLVFFDSEKNGRPMEIRFDGQ